MQKQVIGVLTTLAVLFAVVCAVLLFDSGVYQWDTIVDNKADTLHFQQEIGGVGMGAVMAPVWNFSDYDPRLQTDPLVEIYPIPAGFSYSPDRLSMVSNFNN
jgi:hypothetical protein